MRLKWQLAAVLCLLIALPGKFNAQAFKATLAPSAPVKTTLIPPTQPVHPRPGALTSHAKLEILLVKASASNATQTDVEEALDGILKFTGVNPSILGISSARNQIVSAELAFHNQHHAGITEDRVVNAVNNLSSTWGLPNYTLTSASEVRKLHVAMIGTFPHFMLGDATTRLKPQSRGSLKKTMVRTEMSPLEATLTFSLLTFQKLVNPDIN